MLTTQYAPSKQAGNGVTVAFSVSWKILAASDLAVYKIDATGAQGSLLVITTDYTVSFDPIQETATITYVVAPVTGGFAYITRVSDNTQATSLPREGPAPAKSIETMIDKLQAQVQELKGVVAAITIINGTLIQVGPFATMNALAILNPTIPFMAYLTDYKMVGFYTGNVLLGTNADGWWFGPGGA